MEDSKALITIKKYCLAEELMNSISHGIGTLIAIAMSVLLIIFAAKTGSTIAVVSASIYGFSMILMFTISTLYHSLTNRMAKYVFRILDHCSIFFYIAGIYTMVSLYVISGMTGWIMFGIVTAIVIICITLTAIDLEKYKKINIIFYLILGWLIIFKIKDFAVAAGHKSLIFLVAGGIAYSLGVIPYVLKKYKFTHAIWHIFVLAGSILHFFSILFVLI